MIRGEPLRGTRVIVTRTAEQSEPWLRRLTELGAVAYCLPMIEIVPCDPEALDTELDRFDSYDWVVFTSTNAVHHTLERCRQRGESPAAELARVSVAAVGTVTSRALHMAGIAVSLTPADQSARGVAQALGEAGIAGKRVLLPCSRSARSELPRLLTAAGARVIVVPVYDTIAPTAPDARLLAALREGAVDVLTLASPSAARNLFAALEGSPSAGVAVVCIGETTANAARELGYSVAAVAASPSIDGLVSALMAVRGAQVEGQVT